MSCARQFEVEAARDGRLVGLERDALEAHVRTCSPCRVRSDALAELSRRLRAMPVADEDAMTARRQRTRLLAAFDDSLRAHERGAGGGRRSARWVAVGLAAGALATAALVVVRTGAGQDPSKPISDPVTVIADGASWSRFDDGVTTEVQLRDGTAEFRVDHSGPWHRLVVILPDGQLDDLGTTFRVDVRGGQTVAVAVREGAVVLRLAGHKPVPILAGETWRADPPPVAPPRPPAVPSASQPPAPAAPSPPRESVAPSPPKRSVPRSSPQPPAPAAPSARHLQVAPSAPAERVIDAGAMREAIDDAAVAREFGAAVDLLGAGRNELAAAALRAFLAHHPADTRVEDAAYLLVLALQRSGNSAAMRAAAHEYLRRYPSGFRRPVVEALLR